jgi:benzoyl-CoA reductase subunit C
MTWESLEQLLGEAEKLYRDNSLAAVQKWKEENDGIAIGYMPIYVPREILHAQGVLPVGIMGGGDELEIIRGDAYYQSYICHIPRSTIEMGLNGNLDCLEGMLFPAICDVIRNLSGMWKMAFPEKLSLYVDFPQNFDRDTGGAFYYRELQQLSAELVKYGAKELTAEALRASIAVYNVNRREISAIYELRRDQPWKVPTHELYLLLRAGLVLPVEEHTQMLKAYREAVVALEKCGCYIVDDDFVQIHRWTVGEIDAENEDPLDSLVDAFLNQAIASATRYVASANKGDDLLERVRDNRAEGVLFCAPSFCDPALLDQPMTQKTVTKHKVPWTAFKYAETSRHFCRFDQTVE